MARRRRSALALSGEHARQAVVILIQEGKLKAADLTNVLRRRERLVRTLRGRLAALETGVARVGRQFMASPFPIAGRSKAGKGRARRKPRISAATRRMYQQQGRYMAAVRQLPKADRAKIKAIREKSGVRAATAAAKRMAR